ncbi:AzlC family ABC transporter permease [Clostridium vincentii]|uniref:Inner membrane protein YgaZ n=1 Tax=Clostridium vincentii TaxID=52704 RepID=A0A2T0BJ05_9CLOT|nr:AzlC family ABC transporter permease [Clostridium vincentii]PRR83851.1 Inner membrane protein YgaZ [Clostridium vincentii]
MVQNTKSKKTIKFLSRCDLLEGSKASIPICLGYIPLGIACGILCQKAGLSALQIGTLSLFVYAGSGQFITASLLIASASMSAIIFTTFILNLRHMLMSSTLSPYFTKSSHRFLMLFSHEITDETFAINLLKFKEKSWTPNRAMSLNIISHITWILSTILGGVTGSIFNFNDIIINFVLISMFICLLCLQFKGAIYVLCALISGIIAVSLSLIMNNTLYIIIASLLAATACYFIEKFINERKSLHNGVK